MYKWQKDLLSNPFKKHVWQIYHSNGVMLSIVGTDNSVLAVQGCLLIVTITAANTKMMRTYAKHCSKCFRSINSFNPHN